MENPWDPEQVVTDTLAKELIEQQFLNLKPVQIKELGKGWDNTVYLVNDEYVFRFPRKEIAVKLLLTENKLLPKLNDLVEIPIPNPTFIGKASETYAWPFTGYPIVPGKSPGILTNEQRSKSTKLFAGFLKEVHQFPVDEARGLGVGNDQFGRVNIGEKKEKLRSFVTQAQEKGLWQDEQAIDYFFNMEEYDPKQKQCLVHGDLHIRNFLVDEEGILSGIIDWGDTHIGNPAIDLSIVYAFLPKEARASFYEIYGEVDYEIKELARFVAVYVSFLLMVYGNEQQDENLVKSAQQSLELAIEN